MEISLVGIGLLIGLVLSWIMGLSGGDVFIWIFCLYFGLQVGCMIDNKSLAFRYNKVQKARPIIGCSVIYNGLPIIEPFLKDKTGKWVGKLL